MKVLRYLKDEKGLHGHIDEVYNKGIECTGDVKRGGLGTGKTAPVRRLCARPAAPLLQGFAFWLLGFEVGVRVGFCGSGFSVWSLGFRIQDFGFRVSCVAFRVLGRPSAPHLPRGEAPPPEDGLVFRVSNFVFRVSGLGVTLPGPASAAGSLSRSPLGDPAMNPAASIRGDCRIFAGSKGYII